MKLAIAIFILCNCGIRVHSNCGRRLVNHEALIIGGTESKAGFWPWHVIISHITHNWNIDYKCGGTLLSTYAILTAAHCVSERGQPIAPNRVVIKLGQSNLVLPEPNSQHFVV